MVEEESILRVLRTGSSSSLIDFAFGALDFGFCNEWATSGDFRVGFKMERNFSNADGGAGLVSEGILLLGGGGDNSSNGSLNFTGFAFFFM